MFANQRDSTIGLLILRHLHDNNAIDYPAPADLPQAPIFQILEQNGYVERWDRIWPLSDRYRLTPKGVQAIQSTYKPGNAEAVMQKLRARGLAPEARPQALRAMGFDPTLWPILHDPHTHWMTWPEQIGPYQRYIWEPAAPPRPAPPRPAQPRPAQPRAGQPAPGQPRPAQQQPRPAQPGGFGGSPQRQQQHHYHEIYTQHDDPHWHQHGHHQGHWHDPGYQGGDGESGGGGASVGYDTDNLDQGGGSGGGDYGDVS